MWRRLVAMPFRVVVPEAEQDELLAEKLQAELPGILQLGARGPPQAPLQGHFTTCVVCAEAARWHQLDCDPVAQFVDEALQRRVGLQRRATLNRAICRDDSMSLGRVATLGRDFTTRRCNAPVYRVEGDTAEVWGWHARRLNDGREQDAGTDQDEGRRLALAEEVVQVAREVPR